MPLGAQRSAHGRESTSHPHSRVSITSAFSMRIFRVNGAVPIPYSSRLNRL